MVFSLNGESMISIITSVFKEFGGRPGNDKYRQYHIDPFGECSFEIIGSYPSLIPELEILMLIDEVMNRLEIENYRIQINSDIVEYLEEQPVASRIIFDPKQKGLSVLIDGEEVAVSDRASSVSFDVERLLSKTNFSMEGKRDLRIFPIGPLNPEMMKYVLMVARKFRERGQSVDISSTPPVANDFEFVAIIGERELQTKTVIIKRVADSMDLGRVVEM